jgi:hypothetical protein
MDCKQFREILDCYADRELSVDAAAAADAHLRECAACARVAARLEMLRRAVRHVVADTPPPDLELRVRQSLQSVRSEGIGTRWGGRVGLVAALLLVLAITGGVLTREHMQHTVAATIDGVVIRVADTGSVVLDGVVLCRDCELHRRYGVRAMCARIGHRGAIVTADGRIWNIVEQPVSTDLVHDDTLFGKRVRIRGRIFRAAGTIEINTYQIL